MVGSLLKIKKDIGSHLKFRTFNHLGVIRDRDWGYSILNIKFFFILCHHLPMIFTYSIFNTTK